MRSAPLQYLDIIFLYTLGAFVFLYSLKLKSHFAFLKALNPFLLKDVYSIFAILFLSSLKITTRLALFMPFYVNTNNIDHYSENALYHHHRLKKINWGFAVLVIGLIVIIILQIINFKPTA